MNLYVAGGTDAGDAPAPAVWDDDRAGVERVLNGARLRGYTHVVVVGVRAGGRIEVGSNVEVIEHALGILERGKGHLLEVAAQVVEEAEARGDEP